MGKFKKLLASQFDFNPKALVWSFVGSFLGIFLISFIQSENFTYLDNIFLIGSFGATAVLIYGAPNSPLAQPRNLFGGHLISAFIGVTIALFLPNTDEKIWACALAVSLSIVAMQLTKTTHPPGGATALIANIGSEKIKTLEYWYVINPVLIGVALMFLCALINNYLQKTNRS